MALPGSKDIEKLLNNGSTLEVQEKILELREAAIEIQEENLALKKTLASLKKQLEKQLALSFDQGVYWAGETENRDGPFCPKCFDTKKQSVRLHKDGDRWWCYECKIQFGVRD